MSVRLGEILVKESLITADQLKLALEHQGQHGGRLGTSLMKLGFITDDEITEVLSRQYGVPSINLKYYEVDPTVIKLIPQDTAVRYQIVPLSRVGSTLTIAMTDPTNVFAMDDIKFMTGFNVEPVVASETSINEAIAKFYGEVQSVEELTRVMKDLGATDSEDMELASEEQEMDLATLERAAEEAPIIKLVNLVLTDAVKRGASDIHIEPYERELRVRFRVDGILQAVMTPPLKLKDAITSRIKIMSKLDISEKRLPQDGRIMIKYRKDGRIKELDFRVSTVPTLFGEKIVMRLLDKENLRLDMTKLGFEPESLAKFERAILRPYGMVLVTGPTGFGQDEYALLVGGAVEYRRYKYYDRRGSGGVSASGDQSGADEGSNRAELCIGVARVSAAGSQHYSGRRDSGFRDGGNRGEGRANRPPGFVDAAYQRRAFDDQPPDEHGHRAVSGGDFSEPDLRAAAGAAHLRGLQGAAGDSGASAVGRGIQARRGKAHDGLPWHRVRHLQQERLQRACGIV